MPCFLCNILFSLCTFILFLIYFMHNVKSDRIFFIFIYFYEYFFQKIVFLRVFFYHAVIFLSIMLMLFFCTSFSFFGYGVTKLIGVILAHFPPFVQLFLKISYNLQKVMSIPQHLVYKTQNRPQGFPVMGGKFSFPGRVC